MALNGGSVRWIDALRCIREMLHQFKQDLLCEIALNCSVSGQIPEGYRISAAQGAFLGNQYKQFIFQYLMGVRWAERAFISKGMFIESRKAAAFSMTGRSLVLPMMMLTVGVMLILIWGVGYI